MKQHTQDMIEMAQQNKRWSQIEHYISAARVLPRRRHQPPGTRRVDEKERIEDGIYRRDVYYVSTSTGEVVKEMTVELDLSEIPERPKGHVTKQRNQEWLQQLQKKQVQVKCV